jgi:hypothetical protein
LKAVQSAVFFSSSGFMSLKGGPYPFGCAKLRVTKSARRRSTFADHRISGLREGRMPKSDTPTREVTSSAKRGDPGPRYHQEDLSRPSREGMWRVIGVPCFLAPRNFCERKTAPSFRETRGAEFRFKGRKHYFLRVPIRREVPVAARNG